MACSKQSVLSCRWLRAGINIAGRLAAAEQWMSESSWIPLTPCFSLFEITAGKISGTHANKACKLVLLASGATNVYISMTCEFVCWIQILQVFFLLRPSVPSLFASETLFRVAAMHLPWSIK